LAYPLLLRRIRNRKDLACKSEKKGGVKMKRFIRFLKEEDGLESVEYALLAVLIALGIVGGVGLLAGWINTTFTTVATTAPPA
jgi:Flp pilus assembly pilin Flp